MVSIHTNLSSLITQRSILGSTNRLNSAIEKMSTGYKINHASDNAANYSIATNMSAQISSCNVAADNIAMGMNLVSVAQETVSQMQSRASQLHALITQARNGTYGASSINAINLEAAALVAEIDRAYNNAEYDGIGMIQKFKPEIPEDVGLSSELKPRDDGFLVNPKTYDDAVVNAMTHVKELDSFENGETYAIGDLEDLVKLRTLVNGGQTGEGSTFVMCDDIDMSSIDNWTSIGAFNTEEFKGTFDGNGHVISNLKGNSFMYQMAGTIKNLGMENVNVSGNHAGGIAGLLRGTVSNSWVIGSVQSIYNGGGGIAGKNENHGSVINKCWFKGTVSSSSVTVGGILGFANNRCQITNCFVEGDITANNAAAGGIVGSGAYIIKNCSFKGNVTSQNSVAGGIGGCHYNTISPNISNCYTEGTVSGKNGAGGIFGTVNDNSNLTITNSLSKCTVTASGGSAGGIVGRMSNNTGSNTRSITNCYSLGNVSGTSNVGGIAGYAELGSTISNCGSMGTVTGTSCVGGAIGSAVSSNANGAKTITISNINVYGEVIGESITGGFVGRTCNTKDGSTFTAINFSNCQTVEKGLPKIGGTYKYNTDTSSYEAIDYDTTTWENNIETMKQQSTKMTLQAGLDSANSSQIKFDLGFDYDLKDILTEGCTSDSAYTAIKTFINTLSQKETEFGAVANRLDSALESVQVSMDNLVSSRSTILDADMGKVSSDYLRQQILQQACATLMSTANQSPAIALQLI